MIIKFKTGRAWAYHEVDSFLINENQKLTALNGTTLIYTPCSEAKTATLSKGDNLKVVVYYLEAYLLNNEGGTINCI